MSDTKRYYEFATKNGVVLIEANADVDLDGMGQVSVDDIIHKTGETFESALGQIRDVLEPLEHTIWHHLTEARSLSVEFGFKLSGKAGLIVASSEMEANFKVSICWQKGE